MTKKKQAEHAESGKKGYSNATDNKQDNDKPEINPADYQEGLIPGSSPGATSEAAKESSDPADKVVQEERISEEKLAELQDKYLRLSAEFDNYRKRTLREKIELTKYATEDMLLKIIPIMDDFDRALNHMDTATDCIAMKEGIDLIYNKFSEFLRQNGIKEIESMNKSFDVDLHDAVAKIPVEDDERKGKVVDVVLKGYYLQDKVLRHSKVVVGE